MKDWDIINIKNLNKIYDQALRDLVWRCQNHEEILISNKPYMCHKIDKV